MTIITGNIDSFIKANGITGNAYIDSMIIATAVSFIIAYINGIFGYII